MIQNKRFEQAAKSRRMLALSLAIALHAAVFAVVMFKSEVKDMLPGFIKEMLFKPEPPSAPTASIP